MSAHTADSKFSFELPSLSYVDAKWEEPNLSTPAGMPRGTRNRGLAAWLSRRVAAFTGWLQERDAAAELASMTDRELLDIGLSPADIGRAFTPPFNDDLRQRGRM